MYASSKLVAQLDVFLNTKIKKQGIHKYGESSMLRTIIKADTVQLARFIRQTGGIVTGIIRSLENQ